MAVETPPTQLRSSAARLAGKKAAEVSCVLSSSDLAQIKQRSVILTDKKVEQIRFERETQQAVTRHKSIDRKRSMREKETEARGRREQLAMKMELEEERKALLSGNEMVNNQHLESLRKINSLVMAATGYQLCDTLKKHQQERKLIEIRYNNVFDSSMERDRCCNNQKRKDEERIAHSKRMEALQELKEQISERHKQSIRDEEAKDIESRKIFNLYKQYEHEELEKMEQHREKHKETIRQVLQTNQRIKDTKEQMVIRDKKEEMAAAAYLRKKALEEKAKLQEDARTRKLKELHTAKLRAQQEKIQDKETLHNERYVKKTNEEIEKNTRLKFKQNNETNLALLQSIMQDREKQETFHTKRNQQMRAFDANTDCIGQQQAEREYQRLKAAESAIKAREITHRNLLVQQIRSNDQRRVAAKLFELNDATFAKKKALNESILAEKVRMDTLKKLKTRGVAEEYLRNIRRMSIDETNA